MTNNNWELNQEYTESYDNYLNIYNNEAIGCLAIFAILQKLNVVSVAKSLLILPLAFQDELVSYVGRAKSDIKSIEQLIIRKPDLLSNFNSRFYSLLNVSLNSLLMLISLGLIKIDANGKIHIIEDKEFITSYEKKIIGERANNILKSSSGIAILLDDNTDNLYLQLRVRL